MFLRSSRVQRAFSKILTGVAVAPLLWALSLEQASAQSPPFVPAILGQGDAVVTGFSGIVPPLPPVLGDPLDETFINLDGASMQIQRLQPAGPPVGQLIPSPTLFSAYAKDVGQLFAITTDDDLAPNIYLGASSVFGIQIVTPDSDGDGRPERAKLGAPDASFMDGQWGAALGGTAGTIYRVDGSSGAISVFSTIVNSGPGLGDVVFDRSSHQFFVSDLDSGLIHRLDSTGLLTDTFDHGLIGRPVLGLPPVADDGSAMDITGPGFNAEDPATWGYTPRERMVWGMAMRGGRLYFTVGEPLAVWSIGINLDGTFADTPRWEVDVAGLASNNLISDMVFDGQGHMILAQRGAQRGSYDYTVFAEPLLSSVVRYRREVPDDIATPSVWVPVADEYAIGFRPDGRNATGGITLGYDYDINGYVRQNACGQFIWSTGDSLRDNPALAAQLAAGGEAIVHGLQGNNRDLVRPANDPPFNSYFTDYDNIFGDPDNQGHVGDVEMLPCPGGYGYIPPYVPPPGYPPPPPFTFNLTLDKIADPYTCVAGGLGWLCSYTVRVTNTGTIAYWGPVTIEDWLPANPPGAVVTFAPVPPWLCGLIGPTDYQCTYPPVFLAPGDSLDLYVTVDLPADTNICYLENAARIVWGPGYGDAIPWDDFAFASAYIPDADCPPPGGDKTNLKIEKEAIPDTCVANGANWECQFLITVTNTGPGDYNGEIEVTDTISTGTLISFNPPWNCVAAAPDWVCTHPVILLNPGNTVHLLIKTSVPIADLEAAGKCEVENTAKITRAPGGDPQNFDPTDDTASAIAKVPGVHCPPPPDKKADLTIEKEAAGCFQVPTGWLCGWIIKVTNLGPDEFNAPIKLIDSFSVPPIPPSPTWFGGPWPWACGPDGADYACTLPAAPLPMGSSVLLVTIVELPPDTDVCEINNKATIVEPVGGSNMNTNGGNDTANDTNFVPTPLCDPPIDEKANLAIDKKPGTCTLAAGAPIVSCEFQVTLTNTGPAAITQAMAFIDQTEAFGTPVMTPVDPAWTCPPLAAPISGCYRLGPLLFPAGAVATFNLIVTASLADVRENNCQVRNIAYIVAPPAGPANSIAADDVSAVVAATLPPELCQTNLELTKTASDCTPNNDGGYQCEYELTVKNVGTFTVTGPITVVDTIPNEPGVSAGWNIAAGVPLVCAIALPDINCTYSDDLAPGAQFTFGVSIYVPDAYAQPGQCKIPNTATITSPVGGNQNSDPTDDSVTVIATIPMVPDPALPPGSGPVPCDPPSLSIEKVANPQQCVLGDFGWECTFEITVSSLGPDPFLGPVQVIDVLPAGSILKSASPPWVCAMVGNEAHCQYPSDVFVVGTFITLEIVIAVPEAIAKRNKCVIPNEAHTSVSAAVLQSDQGAQYSATATAEIPGEICEPPPVVETCPVLRKMPDGGCCPTGQRWNGRQCTGGTPTPPCPEGFSGTPPNCVPIVVPQCPSDSVGTPPNCRCKTGTSGTPGKCKPIVGPKCPSDSTGTPPNCRCKTGTTGTPGNCKPIVGPKCPSDSVGTFPNCRCKPGTSGNPGKCKPIVVPKCPTDSVGTFPNCRCKPGTTGTPGKCIPILRACPSDSVGVFPVCRCKPGTSGTPGKCVKIERKCPADSVGTFPNCRCKPGTTGTPGNCKPILKLTPINPVLTVPLLPRRCPADSVGTPPNCSCKPGTQGTPGNCLGIIK